MGELVIIVPMLGRPTRVPPLVESIVDTTPGAHVLFMVTPDDWAVLYAIDTVADGPGTIHIERMCVPYIPIGDYARKINIGYRATTEPHIFTGACDLRFHPNWYPAAAAHLTPGVGVVGTNDLGNPRVIAGQHSTHSLVTREYADTFGTIDEPGKIYHEGYPHEYVDDEMIETAKWRGAFVMAPDAHVEHLHPDWGKAPVDTMYAAQRSRMARGYRRFHTRRALWSR